MKHIRSIYIRVAGAAAAVCMCAIPIAGAAVS
jgi:hypothetical protein